MTLIQIKNGKGRPVNPINLITDIPVCFDPDQERIEMWKQQQKYDEFEQSVTEHEAPGCEEGEAEGELVWQESDEDGEGKIVWKRCYNPSLATSDTRQIWRIVPTPEKVEVKEDDYKTITEDEVKNWCSGSFGNSYILERLTDLLKGEYSLEEARDDVLGFRAH